MLHLEGKTTYVNTTEDVKVKWAFTSMKEEMFNLHKTGHTCSAPFSFLFEQHFYPEDEGWPMSACATTTCFDHDFDGHRGWMRYGGQLSY